MMDAERIDAAPVLAAGAVEDAAESTTSADAAGVAQAPSGGHSAASG
jgi:hypothetical protein